MNKLKISLVQTNLVWENINQNLKNIEEIILSSEKSDIFVLPEMFNTGFTSNVNNCYETKDGETISWMKKIASSTNSAICGSIIFKDSENIYNRFLFVEPNGKISSYNKRHIFGIGGESDIFSSGNTRTVVEYKSFKILFQICYDLRFPVWSRNTENYDAIIYVANWPAVRRNAWDILLQARAIENQCFVIAVNITGTDGNKLQYNGGSCIINFKGEMINKAQNDKNEVISSILDKTELDNFREQFPALKDMDSFEIL